MVQLKNLAIVFHSVRDQSFIETDAEIFLD